MKGLYNKYILQKTDGQPLDEGSEYFILRLDKGGDREHVIASRKAMNAYADHIIHYLPELAKDIHTKWGSYRTLMTVREITDTEVKVFMAQWQPEINTLVSIPKNIIPEDIMADLSVDSMLMAMVNIGCESAEELFFYDFEPVEISVMERSKTIFDKSLTRGFCEICLDVTNFKDGICQEHDHTQEHWIF